MKVLEPKKENHFWSRLWYSVLLGTGVMLLVLNAIPSEPIQYVYRIRAIASPHRLAGLENWLKQEPKNIDSLAKPSSRKVIRFLAIDPVDKQPATDKPVLSTNDKLPNRVVVQITAVSTVRRSSEDLQRELERVSFTDCDTDEVLRLKKQSRAFGWQRDATSHLVSQMESDPDSNSPYTQVSTRGAGELSLKQEWVERLEQQNRLCDNVIEQLKIATTKAHGFIALAGRPLVLPRLTHPLSLGTLWAFLAGATTATIFFTLCRYPVSVFSSPPNGDAKTTPAKKSTPQDINYRTSTSIHHAERLAIQLVKMGIPYLGHLDLIGDDVGQHTKVGLSRSESIYSNPEPTTIQETKFLDQNETDQNNTIPLALRRAIEWVLLVWIAIAIARFLTDETWRDVVRQYPLAGLARLLSGIS